MTFARALALLPAALLAGCLTTRSAAVPQGPEGEVALADRALKAGRHDEAIEGFRRALASRPQDAAAMRGLVEAHFVAGRIEALVAELERAVGARPDDAAAHYGLGLASFVRAADGEAKALEHLGRACALAPKVAEYPFRVGIVHLESERFAQAAESLARARDLDPSQARHHVPLALALARTGDRKGALASLEAILALSPDEHDLKVARGVTSRLNDPFREFPKAIAEQFERGLDYMQRADAPQQAMVIFQEILDSFPDLAVVHAALGLCYQRLDDAGRAMDEYRRALELAPEDPLNHLYVADLFHSKERFDRAAESYREVIARDPLNDRAYERLGDMAMRRGDFEDAARALRVLTVLRPTDHAARQAYGVALMGKGALDEAEAQFLRVVERDPKSVEALLRLGMLNVERQKLETDASLARAHSGRAARYFEKVLDLQPQNVFAARMLKALAP